MIDIIDIEVKDADNPFNSSARGYFYKFKNNLYPHGKRPVVIVCPGGGYVNLTEIETEPVATQYLASGCSAVVLNYTVGNATFPKQFAELGKVILYLRENHEELGIDPDNIIVQGSSAGGHLAVAYAQLWESGHINGFLKLDEDKKELLKINGVILSYAGILYGDWIKDLLGKEYEHFTDVMQIENKVSENFPRSFIWQTYEDELVEIPHSLKLVNSICEKKVPLEYHIFPKGPHALSVAKPFICHQGQSQNFPINVPYWVQMSCNWVWDK